MSRYIDADRLKNGIMQYADKYGEISCSVTAFNILLERFAADVQEVKHGRWKTVDKGHYFYDWKCSVCGGSGRADDLFCPNCGAKMVNEDE